jgi:hypothetical protein
MSDDPAGHYARLGVTPAAPQAAIAAAFRRKARLLHPDVPGTGNVDAFIRVKAAYDVVGDAHRRAAYDRTARSAAMSEPAPPPTVAQPSTRGPRLADLPLALWAGLGGVFCLAVVMVVYQSTRAPAPPRLPPAPIAPVKAPGPRVAPVLPPAEVTARGEPTHYVLPAGGPTILWRRDATRDVYLPSAQVPAFTSVQALRFFPQHGLVEVRLADGSLGLVDASRLTPGDGPAARRAYCAYNAGVAPANGDVLQRGGSGTGQVTMDNRSGQPAVVKLRNAAGSAVATVFMQPGGSATVTGLPDGRYRPDFATGELWSRACNGFAIGMRAQRFTADAPLATLSPLVIPPDLSGGAPAADIPDAAFVRDQGTGG